MPNATQKGGPQSRRASMLCQNPRFGLYLDQRRRRVHQVPVENMPDGTHAPEDCADFIRQSCGVDSRAEIDHNDAARVMLDRIMSDYSKWERQQRQQKTEWPVSDDHLYTSEHAGSGQFGICATCHKGPTPEGHDGCLGTLPGPIMNACCGHGNDRQAYIQYWGEDGASGRELRGADAVTEQRRLIAERGDV